MEQRVGENILENSLLTCQWCMCLEYHHCFTGKVHCWLGSFGTWNGAYLREFILHPQLALQIYLIAISSVLQF